MDSNMSSASSDQPVKERKRSAHWTDDDTDTLVRLLLRYRDSGRTADNGFKPEIWAEASTILEMNTYMGGPKTPDACKSRWQRLQRDYKAAKDMEAMPGFTWDRMTHRLSAAPEAWEHAEQQLDAYKYRKIHLPCFDSLALLCTFDGPRVRPRPRVSKGRSSVGSTSNAGSMMAMPTTVGPSHTTNGNSNGNGAGPSTINGMGGPTLPTPNQRHVLANGSGATASNAMAQLQGQLQNEHGVFNWASSGGAEEDGEGGFETSFTMSDGPQSFNLGQKRPLPFDPALLAGPSQSHQLPIPQGSPPKKPRHSQTQIQARSGVPVAATLRQGLSQSQAHNGAGPVPRPDQHQPQHQPPPPTHHQSQNQNQNQTQTQSHTHNLPPPHTHPTEFYHLPTQDPDPNPNPNTGRTDAPRSPEYTKFLDAQSLNQSQALRSFPSSNSLSAEVTAAGLTEAQRRTEAILRLQSQETEMRDEDLVEIMAEFEGNVAAADTYLAIKKDALRRLWLIKIVKRRKR